MKNREKQLAAQRRCYQKNKRKRYQEVKENRKLISDFISWLKNVPCKDCGRSFPSECMDFDHVRGEKEFSLSRATSLGFGLRKICEEAQKCEVVCSNCHRIRTRKKNMAPSSNGQDSGLSSR